MSSVEIGLSTLLRPAHANAKNKNDPPIIMGFLGSTGMSVVNFHKFSDYSQYFSD
ncbi:MAG: hypothetical protein U9R17_15580 [Thermodesulfobacteriota bacterium]|nr:hypothetical protein [Thermodesulfobacteriota bacterium]